MGGRAREKKNKQDPGVNPYRGKEKRR